VLVRAYQESIQTLPDGSSATAWIFVKSAYTDTSGNYSMTSVPSDKPIMVELMSTFTAGSGQSINLVGEPGGIDSTTPAPDRLRYAMRKALDGTSTGPTPASLPGSGTVTVNFNVGLTDKWWLVDPNYNAQTLVAPKTADPIDETTLPGRTTGTGSRVLGIGDSIATFIATYLHAAPGAVLDLHYAPGVSNARGSFVDYNLADYPANVVLNPGTGTTTRDYFGSLQGGTNDDAWDEAVIFRLLARNFLFSSNLSRTFGMSSNPLGPQGALLTHLSPNQAMIEGLADAMAANLLKSPYLADTEGTALASPVLDIRDISGLAQSQLSPYSAPAIQSLAWELILKANSLPSPGTATDWGNIYPAAMARFFAPPNYPSSHGTYETEPWNLFSQIGRLQEPKSSTEPVDLASIFSDSVLTPLLAPYGLPWPRPSTGPLASFAADWGPDPNTLTYPLPPITLSMAHAVQVNGTYPNLSEGEVAYAGFTLSADGAYILTVTVSPALASTAQLELMMPTFQASPLFFTGSGGSQRVVLSGNSTTPLFHPVRLRLLSPTTQQPDTTVTVSLVPAS
jgi:hypothetical protein